MSYATAFAAPTAPWTSQAPLGKQLSGVDVPNRIRSSSSGFTPDCSRARFAASAAIKLVPSPWEILRSRIPVLLLIHSSLVSTI